MTLALFWQIVVFLLLAAALGFVIGWITRGARGQGERPGVPPREGSVEAALADERDRLRTELAAAREAQEQLEDSLVQLRGVAETRASRVRELEAAEASSRERIARLEQELGAARGAAVPEASLEAVATGPAASPQPAGTVVPPPTEPVQGTRPPALAAPEGEPDDLKKISGIGPGIEKTLHELGIYHFRQIAQLTPDNVAWIDQRLRFRGRIEREDWVGQAQRLAAGETVDRA
jgi:predicted flap endonuclease-1-like 5' DNA nuclease